MTKHIKNRFDPAINFLVGTFYILTLSPLMICIFNNIFRATILFLAYNEYYCLTFISLLCVITFHYIEHELIIYSVSDSNHKIRSFLSNVLFFIIFFCILWYRNEYNTSHLLMYIAIGFLMILRYSINNANRNYELYQSDNFYNTVSTYVFDSELPKIANILYLYGNKIAYQLYKIVFCSCNRIKFVNYLVYIDYLIEGITLILVFLIIFH